MKLTKLTEAPLFTGHSFRMPWQVVDALEEEDYEGAWKYTERSSFQSENPGVTKERVQERIIDTLADNLEIEDGRPVFKFICKALGVGKDNPFIHYAESYPHAATRSKDAWIALNNLYAERTIDPPDLLGEEDSKTQGLLYQDTLFTHNQDSSDLMNVVQSFVEFPKKYGRALKAQGEAPAQSVSSEDRQALQADLNYLDQVLDAFKSHKLATNPKMVQWLTNREITDEKLNVLQGSGDLFSTLVKLRSQWKKELTNPSTEKPTEKTDPVNQKRREIFYDEQNQVNSWGTIEGKLDRLARDLKDTLKQRSSKVKR